MQGPVHILYQRLLTRKEAARYCRLPLARFARVCPVRPIKLDEATLRYDALDIDKWIEAKKVGSQTLDAMLEAL